MVNPYNSGDMSGANVPDNVSSGAGGYSLVAAGISTLSGIVSDRMATQAFKDELNAKTNAAIQNVGNAITSFELQQIKNQENINNINEVLGDKLSERGLAAMKEASMLKAAAAETGTSGGTTDIAIREAFVNENMDKANIVAQARQSVRGILSAMDTSTVSMQHSIDSILLGGGVSVNTNPFLSGVAGGLSTFTNTMSMLPSSEKASMFGIPTQGIK